MTNYFIANKHYPWNREIFDHSSHERPVDNQKARGFSLFVDGVPYSRINYATVRDIPWKPVVIDTRLRGKAITFTVSGGTTPIPEELLEFYVPGAVKQPKVKESVEVLTPPVVPQKKVEHTQVVATPNKPVLSTVKMIMTGSMYRSSFQYPWTRELFNINGRLPPVSEVDYPNIQVSYMNGLFVPLLDVDCGVEEIWDYLSRLGGRVLFKVFNSAKLPMPVALHNHYKLANNQSVFLCKHAAYLIPHVEYLWTKQIRDKCRGESVAEGHPNILVTSTGTQHAKHIAIKVDGVSIGSIKNESGIPCPEINSWESLTPYLNDGKRVTFSTHNTSMMFRNYAMKLYSDVYGMQHAVQETVPEQFRRNTLQLLPIKLNGIDIIKKLEPLFIPPVNHSTRVLETKKEMVKPIKVVVTPESILNGLKKPKVRRYAYTPGLNYVWTESAANIVATPFISELPKSNTLAVAKFMADPTNGRRYMTNVARCGDWDMVRRSPTTNLMYHFTVSDSDIEVPEALISHFETHYGYVFDEILEEEFDYYYKPNTEYMWTPKLQEELGLVGPFACEAHFGNVTVGFFGNNPNDTASSTTSLISWDKIPKDMMVVFTVTEEIKIDKNNEHIIVSELNELNLIKKSV